MSATPLTNADFKKLLETPRAQRGGETPSSSRKSSISFGGTSKVKEHGLNEKTSKPIKKPHKKPVNNQVEPTDEEKDKYRDRAEERRRNMNLDYEEIGIPMSAADGSTLSVEKTKYLGGDMAHTHLVKGLDYALLEKARREAQESEAKKRETTATARRDDAHTGAPAAQDAEANTQPLARTLLARNVHELLVKRPLQAGRPNAAIQELFLPRRTAFLYEFYGGPEASGDAAAADALLPLLPIPALFASDAPSTVRRPKTECPQLPDSLFGGADAQAVLQRIAKVLSYTKAPTDARKAKRDEGGGAREEPRDGAADPYRPPRPRQQDHQMKPVAVPPRAPVSAAEDDDTDIFDDAGRDYTPTIKGTGGRAKQAGPAAPPSEPQDDDMDLEEGEERPPPPPPPPPSTSYDGTAHQQHRMSYPSYPGHADASYLPSPSTAVLPQFYQESAQYGAVYGIGSVYGDVATTDGTPQSYDERLRQQGRSAGGQEKWRVARDVKTVVAEEGDDAYAECFPGTGFGGPSVDSDDEENFEAMDAKGKGKSRSDFGTDEEWQRYKEIREQLPKAAFQFGVKRSDGRKSHKALVESASDKKSKVKLDSQLRQIDKIYQEKGVDQSTAFGRTPARYDDGDESTYVKKRRI